MSPSEANGLVDPLMLLDDLDTFAVQLPGGSLDINLSLNAPEGNHMLKIDAHDDILSSRNISSHSIHTNGLKRDSEKSSTQILPIVKLEEVSTTVDGRASQHSCVQQQHQNLRYLQNETKTSNDSLKYSLNSLAAHPSMFGRSQEPPSLKGLPRAMSTPNLAGSMSRTRSPEIGSNNDSNDLMQTQFQQKSLMSTNQTASSNPSAVASSNTTVATSPNGNAYYQARQIQLNRYRAKRAARLKAALAGHKKIRYECRKTLADNRPRVKGRFAKVHGPNGVLNGQLSTKVDAPRPVNSQTTNGVSNVNNNSKQSFKKSTHQIKQNHLSKLKMEAISEEIQIVTQRQKLSTKTSKQRQSATPQSKTASMTFAMKPDHLVPENQPWYDDDILIDHSAILSEQHINDSGMMRRSFSDTNLFVVDPVAFA